jgi:peptide/nickel transport system permease protein
MSQYVLRRLIQIIPMLILISIFAFFLMRMAPGDPARAFLDPEKVADPERLANIRRSLGLEQPVPIQYLRWLGRVVQGDMGYSYRSRQPVVKEILTRLPNTLILGLAATLLSLIVAVPIGIVSAVKQYSAFDYIATLFAFVGISMPNFWIGLLLIYIFVGQLGILPAVGTQSVPAPTQPLAQFTDFMKHLLMPAVVLGLQSMAGWARYQRSSLLEVIRQDYIRTARAKGLAERVVLTRHALSNALIPLITLAMLSVPSLLGGAFITESIFAWPGMGRLAVHALYQRDYPVIQGVTLFSALLVLLANLAADILYALVDPRVRFS